MAMRLCSMSNIVDICVFIPHTGKAFAGSFLPGLLPFVFWFIQTSVFTQSEPKCADWLDTIERNWIGVGASARIGDQRAQLTAPAAILSTVAARVDPYRLASRLLRQMQQQGTCVFDRTLEESIKVDDDLVQLTSENGRTVRAKHLVVANGYEAQNWLKQSVAKNRSSYAYITDPLDKRELGWLAHTMLWESSRPYIYLRSTGDGRLLVGGEDDEYDIPSRRDRLVERKAAKLQRKVTRLFPQLQLKPAFAWAGTFAETIDGLPLFGPHPQYGPRVLFALAYGGNGITYSMLGAGLLRAHIEKKAHPLSELFSFSRLETK